MDEATETITAELLTAVRQGDEAAARRLIEHLYPTVIAIVRNHLPKFEAEEDLAQDVFLKVFARLGQFRAEKPLRHWVGRIALHTCYDALRRQRRRPVLRFSDLDADERRLLARIDDGHAADSSSADGESAGELVAKLLATLKPAQQLILKLLDLEQRPVKEVAEITGWSHSKIKVGAMRARRQLAKTIKAWEKQRQGNAKPSDCEDE